MVSACLASGLFATTNCLVLPDGWHTTAETAAPTPRSDASQKSVVTHLSLLLDNMLLIMVLSVHKIIAPPISSSTIGTLR